jgi:hypothetical protein
MWFLCAMRAHRFFVLAVLAASPLAIACASCSSSSSGNGGTGGQDGGGKDATQSTDSGGGGPDGKADTSTPAEGGRSEASPGDDGGGGGDGGDGGIQTLAFDPTGTDSPVCIHWDDAAQVLYVGDDTSNQVWTWTDANGFELYATVPDNPALDDAGDTKLNGVSELADGTLVVVRFGFGKGGAIYTVSPDGGTATVPNVPAAEKRLQAAPDPSTGSIYSSAFSGGGGSPAQGKIELVDLTTGTTQYASGFGKTVGILVQGSTIYLSDQTAGTIVMVPTSAAALADGGAGLADGGAFPVLASLSSPDMLTAGPNGTLFTDQGPQSSSDAGPPQVRQIAPDGGVTIPWPGVTFTSLNDVAYDPTHHRLFVVDSNGTTVRTIKVLPVTP